MPFSAGFHHIFRQSLAISRNWTTPVGHRVKRMSDSTAHSVRNRSEIGQKSVRNWQQRPKSLAESSVNASDYQRSIIGNAAHVGRMSIDASITGSN